MGELRFARPRKKELSPKEKSGVVDATKTARPCIQPVQLGSYSTSQGDEDCLKLNVYVPRYQGKMVQFP